SLVVDLLQRALKLGSRDAGARRELAAMLTTARQFKPALTLYEELVRELPGDGDLRLRLAEGTLYGGDYAPALARFEGRLSEAGSQPRVWRGYVDAAASAPEISAVQVEQALRLAAQRPRFAGPSEEAAYLSRLGWVLVREGKRAKSQEWLGHAGRLLD